MSQLTEDSMLINVRKITDQAPEQDERFSRDTRITAVKSLSKRIAEAEGNLNEWKWLRAEYLAQLADDGMKQREIAEAVDLAQATVSKSIAVWRDFHSVPNLPPFTEAYAQTHPGELRSERPRHEPHEPDEPGDLESTPHLPPRGRRRWWRDQWLRFTKRLGFARILELIAEELRLRLREIEPSEYQEIVEAYRALGDAIDSSMSDDTVAIGIDEVIESARNGNER